MRWFGGRVWKDCDGFTVLLLTKDDFLVTRPEIYDQLPQRQVLLELVSRIQQRRQAIFREGQYFNFGCIGVAKVPEQQGFQSKDDNLLERGGGL